jgi:hypothetical protein
MDANRFDRLTRAMGAARNRRQMAKTAGAGVLAAVGMTALGRATLGQELQAESQGFKGDDCDVNQDCRRGLLCNQSSFTCQYKRNCGGKKNDACQGTAQCCNGKNLVCRNKKCKRNKRR